MAPTEIVLDSGDQNLTVYTLKVEELRDKPLIKINAPQTSKNHSNGPKDTKIGDFLRVTVRFSVDGWIAYSDRSKMRNLINKGGIFTFDYAGETFNCNIEKYSMVEDARVVERDVATDPAWVFVKFTVLVGENLSSS